MQHHAPRLQSERSTELQKIYAVRFSGLEAYRDKVWRVLIADFFSRWIEPTYSVLDLGCGYGEFINNIAAANKFAMDLNPGARERLSPEISFLHQSCSDRWPIGDDSVDLVFSSNFFEHLPAKEALQETLLEAKRCLKPGGRLIALGPNVRLISGAYWDFFDHHLALTDLSLAEAFIMAGLQVEYARAKFLPYSMSQGFRPPLWTVKAYLKAPLLWKVFGRQFLVVGRKI